MFEALSAGMNSLVIIRAFQYLSNLLASDLRKCHTKDVELICSVEGHERSTSNLNLLDLIETNGIGCAVIQFGRAHRLMGGDALGMFQQPTIL